jgi:hypothetical protein
MIFCPMSGALMSGPLNRVEPVIRTSLRATLDLIGGDRGRRATVPGASRHRPHQPLAEHCTAPQEFRYGNAPSRLKSEDWSQISPSAGVDPKSAGENRTTFQRH